jgi:GT2 family glycosyltransferase
VARDSDASVDRAPLVGHSRVPVPSQHTGASLCRVLRRPGGRRGNVAEREAPDSLPSVAVIIPALNVAETIGAQLDALAKQRYDGHWEVLVADNGCTDATESVVRSFSDRLPAVIWVNATSRRGINHARNRGARATGADVILYCDGDDVVGEGWIAAMVAALEHAEAVGGALAYRPPMSGEDERVELPKNLTRSEWLPSPLGANCGVRRSTWKQVGGFDEDLDRGACDETDFFWRVQVSGGRVSVAPDAVTHYAVREATRDRTKKSYRTTREMARLHRRYKADGHPRRPVPLVLKNWLWVLLNLPRAIVSSPFRSRYLPAAAQPAGRLVGSLRYRTLYL